MYTWRELFSQGKQKMPPQEESKYVRPRLNAPFDNDEWEVDGAVLSVDSERIVNQLKVLGVHKVSTLEVNFGASIIQYVFEVNESDISIADVARHADEFQKALKSKQNVRITQRSDCVLVVEVARQHPVNVDLETALTKLDYDRVQGSLTIPLGMDCNGEVVSADLVKMPHLLVVGSIGTGVGEFLHNIVISLAARYSPEQVGFVIADPTLAQMQCYSGSLHMFVREIVSDNEDILTCFDYLVQQMESRYQTFRLNGVSNIEEYNKKHPEAILQRVVFVLSEFAPLATLCTRQFESKLQRLAQKSRAAGIHLIFATQNAGIQNIGGVVKASFFSRICFKLPLQNDCQGILNDESSRCLLDEYDFLYMSPENVNLQRLQPFHITSDEILRILSEITVNNVKAGFPRGIRLDDIYQQSSVGGGSETNSAHLHLEIDGESDPLCRDALLFWLERQGGRASIASIQRALKIGFSRAGRIMDEVQRRKLVDVFDPDYPSRPLKVLVDAETVKKLFPQNDD